jgi:hypothetical protein
MARGPKTSLLTMLSGGISRLKTTIYTGFVKNRLGTLCEMAHKVHRRTCETSIRARRTQPSDPDEAFSQERKNNCKSCGTSGEAVAP